MQKPEKKKSRQRNNICKCFDSLWVIYRLGIAALNPSLIEKHCTADSIILLSRVDLLFGFVRPIKKKKLTVYLQNVDSMTYTKSARRLQHLTNTCARFRERKAQEKAEAKTAFMKKRRDEFTEKGLKVAFYGTVETKVKCAAMCTDHILGERRNK